MLTIEDVLHHHERGAGAQRGEHGVAEHLKRDPLEPAAYREGAGLGLRDVARGGEVSCRRNGTGFEAARLAIDPAARCSAGRRAH